MKHAVEGIISATLFGILMFTVVIAGLCFEETFIALRMIIFGE